MGMNDQAAGGDRARTAADWRQVTSRFQQPSVGRSVWQVVNTVLPYIALWFLMVWSLSVSPWLTVPLAIVAGGFLVRIFIILHDCGHGSFFRSSTANEVVGSLAGVLVFTPFRQWRWEHAIHHGSCGDLDRRGLGDIWTMTVQEYLSASRGRRIAYRLARHPAIMLLLGPLFVFLIQNRIPSPRGNPAVRASVHATNLAIVAMAAAMSWAIGLQTYLVLQLAVVMVAGGAGLWLFYVQHQFEGVYWRRGDQWDPVAAALQGSSFYRLPRVLQWFTGSIGFHHLHHLDPRIPNYNLEKCHRADPVFQTVPAVTLLASLKCVPLRLWDEQRQQLVGFDQLRTLRPSAAAGPG